MYRTIRSLHLCAGCFALVFLAVYAVSALQMTHGDWVRMTARTGTRDAALPAGLSDARAAARELAARYGIAGELSGIRVVPGGLGFRILRPGRVWQVDYAASSGSARVRLTDSGMLGALNRIHQMRGVWHNWMAYNLWAMLLGVVGCAVLTLGASGVWLWWQTNRDHRVGGALVGIAVAVAGGLAAWMRVAG